MNTVRRQSGSGNRRRHRAALCALVLAFAGSELLCAQTAAPTAPSGNQVWNSRQEEVSQEVLPATASRDPVALVASNTPTIPREGNGPVPPATAADHDRIGTTNFVPAAQPPLGIRAPQPPVQMDARACEIPPEFHDFSPTPVDPGALYDPVAEMEVYEGKELYANRRPLVEIGRPWYQLGPLPPPSTLLGNHNPMSPQFIVYGDWRVAYASNDLGADSTSLVATALNLNFDLRLTSTERFAVSMTPFQQGTRNLGWLLDEDRSQGRVDGDLDFGMFEGDLGALVGGPTGQTLPFDLPFAVGVIPLFFQNGTWMDDSVLGAAVTIPARNSAWLDISNMDTTFFAAFDDIDSDAFPGDNNAAKFYGIASWIEAAGGYIELNYGFLEDRDAGDDRSYHNLGAAYSRRFGRLMSTSARVLINAGQDSPGGGQTADGTLFLYETSLITSRPSTFVPYLNLFAGFDRPQSVARGAQAGGLLRNVGILFESDFLTGYPTLDARAHQTAGAAMGLNILTCNFDQQLILEVAALHAMEESGIGSLAGDQYGAGIRYQIPLSNAWIFRTDAMYGALREAGDIHGMRVELRHKF